MIRKAVIPAAGLGTIFLPATKAQPKEMLPVIDKPVIQWIFPKKDTLNICVGCLYSKLQKNILEYLKNLLSDLEKPVKEKRITRFTSALVPLVPARRIYGERMLVVGDAARVWWTLFPEVVSHMRYGVER